MGPENPPHTKPGRLQCPPADVIIDYGLNDIAEAVRSEVDSHIKSCPYCKMEVNALREALEETFEAMSDKKA